MAFGVSKKVPGQGTSIGSGAPTQQSRVTDKRGTPSSSTPGLTDDAVKANFRPKPQGGSGTTSAGGPKPFKA